MTEHEKIVVSAYTGVLMCDFNKLHRYFEEKLERPVFTHEMASKEFWEDELEPKVKEDFLKICEGPEIDPSDDNFGCILNCAVRYSLGRKTYMPGLVIGFITPLLPYLSDKTLWCFERDVSDCGFYGDPHIDEPQWMKFLAAVRLEIQHRK